MSPTWGTATDWDNAQSENGTRHEASQSGFPTAGDDKLEKGPPSTLLPNKTPLIFHPYNEDSGTTVNNVAGTPDSTAVSGTTISTSGGPLDNGYRSFDGNDDEVLSDNTVTFTAHTFGAWIRIGSGAGGWQGIVSTKTTGSPYSQFVLYENQMDTGVGVRVQTDDVNGNRKQITQTGSNNVNTDTWRLVGVTWDGGDSTEPELYVDGSQPDVNVNNNETFNYSGDFATEDIVTGPNRDDFRFYAGDIGLTFVDDEYWTSTDWTNFYNTFL